MLERRAAIAWLRACVILVQRGVLARSKISTDEARLRFESREYKKVTNVSSRYDCFNSSIARLEVWIVAAELLRNAGTFFSNPFPSKEEVPLPKYLMIKKIQPTECGKRMRARYEVSIASGASHVGTG